MAPRPGEHLATFADLYHVMNDAPLEQRSKPTTPRSRRRGCREWGAASRRRIRSLDAGSRAPDGSFAGLHNVTWKAFQPAIVNVEDTGVPSPSVAGTRSANGEGDDDAPYPGRRASATDIRTGNADSNDAMLGINREMGYVPMMATTTFELDVGTNA